MSEKRTLRQIFAPVYATKDETAQCLIAAAAAEGVTLVRRPDLETAHDEIVFDTPEEE